MQIGNFTPDLIEQYCKFLNKATADRPDYEEVTVENIKSWTDSPYYDHKGHLLAFINNEIVADAVASRDLGYMILPADTTGINLNVLPEHRRRGVGRRMLLILLENCREKGFQVVVTDGIHTKCRGALDFYKKMRFDEEMRSYWMVRELSSAKRPVTSQAIPKGYLIRSLGDREELEVFRKTINEAFGDTPYFSELTEERFHARYLGSPFFDLDGFFVAVHEETDSVVGTTASIILEYDRTKEKSAGHIMGVGVVQAHRGRGLARLLTARGMEWLVSRGVTTARLGTSNPVAFRMYRSLGFEVLHEYVRLRKKIG